MSYVNFNKTQDLILGTTSASPNLCLGVRGKYTIIKRKVDTDEVVQELEFDNIITDLGMNILGTYHQAPYIRTYLGTGTSTPTASNTKMDALSVYNGSAKSRVYTSDVSPGNYARNVTTWEYAAGAAVGTFTEIGVGWNSSPTPSSDNYLFSRQLIQDSGGSPVAITVLSNEYLTVVYEFRVYPNFSDVSGSISFAGGGTYGYTLRACMPQSWSVNSTNSSSGIRTSADSLYGSSNASAVASFGSYTDSDPVISAGTLQSYNGSYCTFDSYISGSYKNSTSADMVTTSQANFASGILAIRVGPGRTDSLGSLIATYHMAILTTPIPKTSLNTFVLKSEVSWARR